MNLLLQLIAVVSLQYGSVIVNGQNYVLTSSCGDVVTEGSSCVFTCETGDASKTPIAWTVGTSSYEVARATCTTSIPSVPSDYVIACPGTNFTLTITVASVIRDKNTWRCDHSFGGSPSNIINLDVQGTTTSAATTGTSTSQATSHESSTDETTTLPASPTTRNNTSAATPSDPCDSDCAWNAVIILVVLLVVKIVTDVIFVAHRWGDKCKQIIDKKRHILYRICFVQGIINSICGVVFIIIICAAYAKCLGEALAIAALVISIFVLITGLIYIVIFLCKQIIDKKRNILNWICFVQGIINSICGVVFIIIICAAYAKCLEESLPIAVIVIGVIVVITGVINIIIVFVHPGDNSSPDHPPPSSLPPIPPSMASPRKPVPPSSTTARTLPSPTSDPASDSAVHPTVHLEPLSVEEPKKKKKKRKKRKKINEAGGETSDQLKNPAGDSDE